VVFLLADQWRAQATGYSGDPNVKTPRLDAFAGQSVNFTHAISTCPVCSPYRASLITGRYPLTHGVFLNDVHLSNDAVSIAQAYRQAGYQTAYIGKWHLDGRGRSSFIPHEARQGFEYWKVLECTHEYNRSPYYGDTNVKRMWEGYDAIAQTRDAQQYIKDHRERPFLLLLSWGPPHNPYNTALEQYRKMYDPDALALRPNVPSNDRTPSFRSDLAGYYAHISALDACVSDLLATLKECGIEDNTIVVFTSDHGDMLGSQGQQRKQRPYDESIRVPLLIRWPAGLGGAGRTVDAPMGTPDLMPTLLGLCGIPIPKTAEGLDFSGHLAGGPAPGDQAALIACYTPFGEFLRRQGGREYRGIRTRRYTYVRDLNGPWLLFDNQEDPYQLRNLCNDPSAATLQGELDAALHRKLAALKDEFRPGPDYITKWGYVVDKNGTVPYKG
jgi:arylsulfatase A-like enzyme